MSTEIRYTNHIRVLDASGKRVSQFIATFGPEGISVTSDGVVVRTYYESLNATIDFQGPVRGQPGQYATVITLPAINRVTVKDSQGNVVDRFDTTVGPNGISIMNDGRKLREYYESLGAKVVWHGNVPGEPGYQSTTITLKPGPVKPDPIIENTKTPVKTTPTVKTKPSAPPKPVLEKFEKKRPEEVAGLQTVNKFSYFFGLGDIHFRRRGLNNNCCYITKQIELDDSEEIKLDSTYSSGEYSSIEFSILEGNNEYPIIPMNDEMIRNEKIFFKIPLRFEVDNSQSFVIKKDGEIADITIEQAIDTNDGNYTIDYYPIGGHTHALSSQSVQLKIILRLYREDAEAPYIKSVRLKGYGGERLWKDQV